VRRFPGKRILVVEDEAMVAAMLCDMLKELEAICIGPAASIAKGLDLARANHIDAAVLDVNVRGERIDPVATLLAERGVPILFATGYGSAPDAFAATASVIEKPYTIEKLGAALSGLFTA
jgi:DNA-binding response OmpR family regulator